MNIDSQMKLENIFLRENIFQHGTTFGSIAAKKKSAGKRYEPAHDKTYNKTCVTSKNSDQPVHLCSLIRVFTDSMCPLQPPDYPKKDE